jgi:NAD(P)-dependent dehydrogenase (short-subunit alcohol dehydrogenase family)
MLRTQILSTGLVNNAGVGFVRTSEQATEADVNWVMNVNFMGVVRCTKAVLAKYMSGIRARAGSGDERSYQTPDEVSEMVMGCLAAEKPRSEFKHLDGPRIFAHSRPKRTLMERSFKLSLLNGFLET